MSTEAMLDLETLGKGSKAVIVAVGVVKFDRATNSITDTFYSLVDPESCVKAGLVIDASTVMWWLQRSEEARKALMPGEMNKPSLIAVCDALMTWYGGDRPTWGNGSTFDNVIMRNAFEAVGFEAPWSYWNDRCYRTIKSEHPDIKIDRSGVHHNALDDAITQANHLMAIFRNTQPTKEQQT